MADRVRMQVLALATTALGQSPSFWHAGTDLLRSKSLDRNSYDSGDWFNRVDWSGRESTFGSGLPPRPDNEAKWDYHAPAARRPGAEARRRPTCAPPPSAPRSCCASAPPRGCSGSAPPRRIQEHLTFPDEGPGQTPGVIVMRIRDAPRRARGRVQRLTGGDDADRRPAGGRYRLHRVQAHGADPVVKQSRAERRRAHRARPHRRGVHENTVTQSSLTLSR